MTTAHPRLTELAPGGGCGCKIAPDVLREIIGETGTGGDFAALMVDASTSDDAAVYRLGDEQALIATTDFFMPIVDDPYDFGRIAATNALSDVYAMGGRPIFCLAIVGMPINMLPRETIGAILAGGRAVCLDAGAPVAGGHSIDSVEPIYGVAAIGLAHPREIRTNAGARPGDVLVLGKPLGVGVFSAAFKNGRLSDDGYAAMIASTTLLNRPGAALARLEGVTAMTDVTGFGLLGHLSEVCRASGVAAHLDDVDIPVFEEAEALLADGVKTGASARNWNAVGGLVSAAADWPAQRRDLLTDPQTSGGLLVSCRPDAVDAVIDAFRRDGHDRAAVIGEVREGAPHIYVR